MPDLRFAHVRQDGLAYNKSDRVDDRANPAWIGVTS